VDIYNNWVNRKDSFENNKFGLQLQFRFSAAIKFLDLDPLHPQALVRMSCKDDLL